MKEEIKEEFVNREVYPITLGLTQYNPEWWDKSSVGIDRSIIASGSSTLTESGMGDSTSWVMGGKVCSASADKVSVEDKPEEEDEERNEVEVEELEEDMTNLSE